MSLSNIDEEVNDQITEVLSLVREVLGSNILGVYLYGSATLGGLQKYSDLDLFAVSSHNTTKEEKKSLVERLLSISNEYPPTGKRRPIELTLVLKSELMPWKFPPSFDFQYGEWMRKDFEKGKIEPWTSTINADIAIIVTQIFLAGESLFGPPSVELLDAVPYKDFMKATAGEIDDLIPELKADTRNVLLTLVRIWHTLTTDSIGSKQDIARWALLNLPPSYKPVFEHALAVCLGEEEENWGKIPDRLVKQCAEYTIGKIHLAEANLDYNDSAKRVKITNN